MEESESERRKEEQLEEWTKEYFVNYHSHMTDTHVIDINLQSTFEFTNTVSYAHVDFDTI